MGWINRIAIVGLSVGASAAVALADDVQMDFRVPQGSGRIGSQSFSDQSVVFSVLFDDRAPDGGAAENYFVNLSANATLRVGSNVYTQSGLTTLSLTSDEGLNVIWFTGFGLTAQFYQTSDANVVTQQTFRPDLLLHQLVTFGTYTPVFSNPNFPGDPPFPNAVTGTFSSSDGAVTLDQSTLGQLTIIPSPSIVGAGVVFLGMMQVRTGRRRRV